MGDSSDMAGGQDRPRIGRRRFLTAAGAAVAGSAGLLARGALGSSGATLSQHAIDEAAGPPDGLRLGVHRVIWSVETTEPAVAFTFDDGPDAELTWRVLDILDRYDVKATFFVMGHSVTRLPGAVTEAVARGHEIGNHTWTHVDLTRQSPEEARWQLELCQKAVQGAIGTPPKYFRPPRGLLDGTSTRYAAEANSDIILWSLGRGVSGVGTPRAVAAHVVDNVQSGDILLLHDGVGRESLRTDLDGPGPIRRRREVEIEALPAIIEGVLDRGLRPTTVSGLLAAAGVEA